MLVLDSGIREPTGLAFAPDGQALVAQGENRVQVWPRWFDAPPRAVFKTDARLERLALSPDAALLFQYVSGDSRTRVLKVATARDTAFPLPTGPAWFHFTEAGGFFLVCHGRGKLTRFDFAPAEKKRVRVAWSIERVRPDGPQGRPVPLGSHYAFGDICGSAGVFVAMEYLQDRREERTDGLVVRSVADGSVVHRQPLTEKEADRLVMRAGLTLTIHPSAKYFAYPDRGQIRFHALTDAPAPKDIRYAARKACHAVAFHPSGSVLAAAGANGRVRLYDPATGKVAREFAWGVGPLRAIAFSPDGTRAAGIGEGKGRAGGKVVVWDVDL